MAYDETGERALLDEALKKSSLVWLVLGGRTHGRWHAWLDGRLYLLTGAGEQPDPGLAGTPVVRIVVRSKDDQRHLLTVDADISRLEPSDSDWESATTELAKLRLNLSDASHAPARWTSGDFAIFRLTPRLPLIEEPGRLPDDSRRRAPAATPATTSARAPRATHRRCRFGRRLP